MVIEMEEKNMTALISCFARYYHYKNNDVRMFSDNMAEKILSKEEYSNISKEMIKEIKFFNPSFVGSDKDALKWIVNNQLSPSVLGRSAFCERFLKNAYKLGCKQYLIFASGYDTFGYRNNLNGLKVFEIDRETMINDKIRRLDFNNVSHDLVNYIKCDFTDKNWLSEISKSTYNYNKLSFCSLLGISYYLSKVDFYEMLKNISNMICDGSSIVFDYPNYEQSNNVLINEMLASGAGEEMKSKYSYSELEKELSNMGLYIYEHLNDEEMTKEYFENYNKNNKDKMIAPKGVGYCLVVKK